MKKLKRWSLKKNITFIIGAVLLASACIYMLFAFKTSPNDSGVPSNTTSPTHMKQSATPKTVSTSMPDATVPSRKESAQRLHLDITMPEVIDLAYANGKYIALTEDNQIYATNDAGRWEKTGFPDFALDKKESVRILTGENCGFVYALEDKLYFSKDGFDWELILHDENMKYLSFNKWDESSQMANNTICVFNKKGDVEIMEKNGLKIVVLPKSQYSDLASDGSLFAAYPKDKDTLHFSKDAIKWIRSDIKGIDEMENQEFAYPRLYSAGEKKYVWFDGNSCLGAITTIHEISEDGKGGFLTKKHGSSLKNNEDNKDKLLEYFFDNCDDFYGFNEYGYSYRDYEYFPDVVHHDDTMLIIEFVGAFKLRYLNNSLFYIGDFGTVIQIDENLMVKWFGLYEKSNLTEAELNNPDVGGAFNIHNDNESFWFVGRGGYFNNMEDNLDAWDLDDEYWNDNDSAFNEDGYFSLYKGYSVFRCIGEGIWKYLYITQDEEKPEWIEVPSERVNDIAVYDLRQFPRIGGSNPTVSISDGLYSAATGFKIGGSGYKNIEHTGTSSTYKMLLNGEQDMIIAQQTDSKTEKKITKSDDYDMKEIAKDALIFYTPKSNPVDSLSIDQLNGILTGKITNWKEVGGEDKPIKLICRNEEGGSQILLNKYVLKGKTMIDLPEDQIAENMRTMSDMVCAGEREGNTLGYNTYYYVKYTDKRDSLKQIAISGITADGEHIADGTYPFIAYIYAVVQNYHETANRFYDWLTTPEGQKMISKTGFIPLY